MNLKKCVWIIDRQHWPRALLRGELLESGLDAVGFVSIEDALADLDLDAAPRPDMIVLELKGLGDDRDENLARLAGTGLPVILLGGAVELNKDAIRYGKWAGVLKRPFTLGQIVQLVKELLVVP